MTPGVTKSPGHGVKERNKPMKTPTAYKEDQGKPNILLVLADELLTGCYASALRSRMVGCVTPDDRRNDPDEMINLWRDPGCAAIRTELLARTADHLVCAVDGLNGRSQVPYKPVAKYLPVKREPIQ